MKKSGAKKVAGGVALGAAAGVAGAGAAYYFLGSKDAKKHQKAAKAWMVKAQKEIMAEAKKLKVVATDKKNYDKIVKVVSEKYKKAQKLDAKDVAGFVKGIQSDWQKMSKMAKAPTKKVVKKAVQKVVKKVAKKVGKK